MCWKDAYAVLIMMFSLCCLRITATAVGEAGQETHLQSSCREDSEVSLPSDRKAASCPAMVQERKRGQDGPTSQRPLETTSACKALLHPFCIFL